MSEKSEEYILGSSEAEIERLAFQNEVWSKETFDLWEKAEISFGNSVVDLGCGPGFCTFPLANLVGTRGHIYAVDSSPKFATLLKDKIKSSNKQNISFHQTDAESLNLPESSADAVFARWLFCFLENPAKVLKEIKKTLKPGGSLIIMDYFNYKAANIFPRNKTLSELFKAYLQIVESHKGSYNVGEILPEIIVENSFEIESLTPICRVARPGSRTWKWVELFNEVSIPALVEQEIWSEQQKEDFEKEWTKAAANPAAFFFPPPMIGIIARKSL